MKFRYRFKGKVNSQFVVRGMLFRVGNIVDFCFTETEVEFAKKHCTDIELVDLEYPKVVETPKPVLENIEKEVVEKPKGVKTNGKKQVSGTSQKSNSNNI